MSIWYRLKAWFKSLFSRHKGWLKGWRAQDYKNAGYNGEIEQWADESVHFYPATHDDVTGYRTLKCEIFNKIRKPKELKFSFSVDNYTKTPKSYTVIQQFVKEILAPICYLTLYREVDGTLSLLMQNKVQDDSDRGYSIPTLFRFRNIDESGRNIVIAKYAKNGFEVTVNSESSGFKETPFLEYSNTNLKLGCYLWAQPLKEKFTVTIYKADIK